MSEPLPEAGARRRGSRALHVASLLAPVVFVLLVIAIAVALLATAQPSFYARFHGFDRRFTKLEQSSHANISCVECHGRTGAVGLVDRVGDFYGSILGTISQPAMSSFGPPTNAACLQCHRNDWADQSSRTSKVPHPAHLRVADETRPCVSCHRWISHEETYQAFHKTMPFSGVCAALACHVGTVQRSQCGTCHHALAPSQVAWRTSHPAVVRQIGPNACLQCHTSQQCVECHTTGKAADLPSAVPTVGVSVESQHVKADWLSVHGTIALKSPAVCASCHISNGECLDCHANRPAFHGSKSTWLNKHQKIAVSQTDPRCITCHAQSFCDACHAQFKQTR